jgi:hypothetical protein
MMPTTLAFHSIYKKKLRRKKNGFSFDYANSFYSASDNTILIFEMSTAHTSREQINAPDTCVHVIKLRMENLKKKIIFEIAFHLLSCGRRSEKKAMSVRGKNKSDKINKTSINNFTEFTSF